MEMPSKQEQFKALSTSTAYDLAVKYIGPPPLQTDAYKQIFNISRSEFIEWLRKNYELKDLPFVYLKPSNTDGYYIIREGGLFHKYRIYYQEKLAHMEEGIVGTLQGVYEKYAEHCLKHSGTGLPLEWWDR